MPLNYPRIWGGVSFLLLPVAFRASKMGEDGDETVPLRSRSGHLLRNTGAASGPNAQPSCGDDAPHHPAAMEAPTDEDRWQLEGISDPSPSPPPWSQAPGPARRRMSNLAPAEIPAGLLIQGLIKQKAKLPGDSGTGGSRHQPARQGRPWCPPKQGKGVASRGRHPLHRNPPFIKPCHGGCSPLRRQTCRSPRLPLARQLNPVQGRGGTGSAPSTGTFGVPGSPQLPVLGGEEHVQPLTPQNKGRSSAAVMGKATPRAAPAARAPHEDLAGRAARLPWTKRAGRGGFPGRSPPVPARSRGGVSLTDHNTASSFLFLFSVLLAKQHNVYTSGYYICQNNYGMTNGTSM